MSIDGNEPEFGQRLPGEPARTTTAPPASPRAARRMARGLSFTLVLLGVLTGSGLSSLGHPWGWAAGALLALPGAAGFAAVQAQLHPALRDVSAPPLRTCSKLWLIPSALLLVGLVPLGGAFAVESALEGTSRAALVGQYVGVLVVSGMTLVVAAALGFGLVATVSLTPPDDDDSPLRPTGYADRVRRPGPGPLEHYDAEWIHRRPPPGYGSARQEPEAATPEEAAGD